MLQRLSAIWIQPGAIPHIEVRLDIIAAFAAAVRQLGPANFLYSDGDTLFAHGDRRKSSVSATVEAPGLVFLQRECPPVGVTIAGIGLSLSAANQAIVLVASVPLTAEPWQAMAEGELKAFRAGRVVGSRSV